MRLQGAAGRSGAAAARIAAQGRGRRRVLPQGVARPRRHRGRRRAPLRTRRRCTSSTACRSRSTPATCCVGEGYRLLAGCGAPAHVCAELVRIAAAGHRELCLGQGAELAWMQQPGAAHRRSGARHLPAQDVAGVPGGARHRRGAGGRDARDAAGAARLQRGARHRLSDSRRPRGPARTRNRRRPRLRRAVAAAGAGLRQGEGVGPRAGDDAVARRPHERGGSRGVPGAARRARRRGPRARAARGLQGTGDPHAAGAAEREPQGLLRRVVGKVFRVEIKGWCSEFETRDAAGRQAGAQAAG